MIGWLLIGCTGALLPGERVLGDEVPASVIEGEAGSGFGSSVAIGVNADGEVTVLIGAPDIGQVMTVSASGEPGWRLSGEGAGFGTRVGWVGTHPWAWDPGRGLYWLEWFLPDEASTPGDTAVDVCADSEVLIRDGRGETVACGEDGFIATRCEGAVCAVEALGSDLDGEETSAGSAVGFWGDTACYGDARVESDEARGDVRCEDGTKVSGEPGDHLGLAIGGGRVAGLFNRHLQPPRARIVPLEGGDVWVVDRAAERSRISLDGGHGLFAVGVPGFGATEAREGRVYLMEEDQ